MSRLVEEKADKGWCLAPFDFPAVILLRRASRYRNTACSLSGVSYQKIQRLKGYAVDCWHEPVLTSCDQFL
jgi:hypothetical protein